MTEVSAVSAGCLYAAALVMLLVVRSCQQYRVTGSAGFNGLRGARTPAARVAGIGFAFAVLAGAVSPVLAAQHVLPMLWPDAQSAAARTVSGAAIAVAGVVVAVAAQRAMGTSWRIGVDSTERTDLVTGGPFAVVRNPIFTALIIIQFGTTVMAPTWLAVVSLVALTLACQLQVRLVEEPYLRAVHQTSYRTYAEEAGRFVPVIGQLRRTDQDAAPPTARP